MSKMRVNKLILLGCEYKRTLEFNEGLTIIRGDRTSGKSLVLSLIDYCMGKSENIKLKVQKQLDEYCNQVLLEITINDEIITLRRNLKKNQNKISIYFCKSNEIIMYTPKVVDIKDAMRIVMRKLKINEYKVLRNKVHSKEQTLETISFRDIFRYVYINQHSLGTDNFLENKSTFKKYKNPYAFELIFNLIEPDKDQINIQLVNAKNNLENTKKEIVGLQSYLNDKEVDDIVILSLEAEEMKTKINNMTKNKEIILLRNNENNSRENEMYIKLKEKLMQLTNDISFLQDNKEKIKIAIVSKEVLLKDYDKEKQEVKATMEMNYKLTVDDQFIQCPLCSSNVSSNLNKNNKLPEQLLEKMIKDINKKSKLVRSLIDKDINKIKIIDKKILKLKDEEEIFNKAMLSFSKKVSVPILSQIEGINSMINSYNQEYENINECLRIYRKIDEKEKAIEELIEEINTLENSLKALKVSGDKKEEIFKVINKRYKEYMKRLKYDISNTYIDFDEYIPYHDGASVFEHESGGLLECMQISFLAAIITSKKDGYALGHPGFLLLDSISKYLGTIKFDMTDEEKNIKGRINDPEIYEEIYKIFVEINNENQLIIVDNTPPVKFNRYSKYTFLSGKEGLINLDINEMK